MADLMSEEEASNLPDWGTFNQICQAIVRRAKQEIDSYQQHVHPIEIAATCEDIMKYLVAQNEVITYVNTLLNQMQRVTETKSDDVAKETRSLARNALLAGNLEKAGQLYTKSLMKADINGDEYLTCLINRSAVLYAMAAYKDCLLDTHLIINCPRASNSVKCSVYCRRIECLRKLGLDHEADVEGEKATTFASSINDNNLLIRVQRAILESANITRDEREEKKPINIDLRVKNASKLIEGASDKVDVSIDQHKGRCLIAKEQIEPSEVILHEDAFITWLEPKYYQEYCLHCLSFIKNKHSIPCDKCTHAIFCSSLCRDAANKEYHEKECSHLLMLVRVSRVHTAVRMILKVGVDNALNWDSLSKTNDGYKFASDYSIIRTYIDHLADINGNIRMGFALVSLMVTRLIFPGDSRLPLIAALIMRHSLQVWCNALSIEHDTDGSTKFLQCNTRYGAKIIGIGVYPVVTLLNHACTKKTYVIFRGKSVTIKSVDTFISGEEITFNYGPWDKKMSVKDRQECLKSNFMFTCTCISCSTGRECIEESYCCYQCNSPAVINHCDNSSICTVCNERDILHIEQIDLVRKQIRPILRESANLIHRGCIDQAIDIVSNLENNLIGLFHPISNTMISMRENLANLLEKQCKWRESASIREICLTNSIKQTQGNAHFNHLYFNMKICKMLIRYIESTKDLSIVPEAIDYFHAATNLLQEIATREALILEAPPEIVSCLPELKDIKETLAKLTYQCNNQQSP